MTRPAPAPLPPTRRGRVSPTFVTDMGPARLAAFTASTVFGAIVIAKLLIGLPLPDPGHIIPVYIVVAGVDLVVIGLLCADIRGVVLTAVGLMLVAIGGVVALVDATGRTQALFFGFPLFTVAATGVAMFGHGTLHGRPSLVLWGARIAIYGFAGSVVAIVYGVVVLLGREHLHGDPIVRLALAAAAFLSVCVAGAAVFLRGEVLQRALDMLKGGRT